MSVPLPIIILKHHHMLYYSLLNLAICGLASLIWPIYNRLVGTYLKHKIDSYIIISILETKLFHFLYGTDLTIMTLQSAVVSDMS